MKRMQSELYVAMRELRYQCNSRTCSATGDQAKVIARVIDDSATLPLPPKMKRRDSDFSIVMLIQITAGQVSHWPQRGANK